MHVRTFPRRKKEATRELKDVGGRRVWEEKPGEEKSWEA